MADASTLPGLKRLSHLAVASSARPSAGDDLLSMLAPATALDALSSATGPLKAPLEAASAMDRDFALRAALASKQIFDWLHEVAQWPWPSHSPSAGFELSPPPFHFSNKTAPPYEALAVQDAKPSQQRLDQIRLQLDQMAVEEIKNHVLASHIAPLSASTTPTSSPGRSPSTTVAYSRMEDMAAIVTTLVIQMLPNLAKLALLLRLWSIRFSVLSLVPRLLSALQDAESDFEAAWATVRPQSGSSISTMQNSCNALEPNRKHQDFHAIQRLLSRKISRPAPILDSMLDLLEGSPDVLPDSWLQRVEVVEEGYGKWLALCERELRQEEWATSLRPSKPESRASPQESGKTPTSNNSRPQSNGDAVLDLSSTVGPASLSPSCPDAEEPQLGENIVRESSTNALRSSSMGPSTDSGADGLPSHDLSFEESSGRACLLTQVVDGDVDTQNNVDEAKDEDAALPLSPMSNDWEETSISHDLDPLRRLEEFGDEQEELSLPILRNSRSSDSLASEAFTVVYASSTSFDDPSSDPPEVSNSPRHLRGHIHEAQYHESSPASPFPRPPNEEAQLSAASTRGSWPAALLSVCEAGDSIIPERPADSSFADDDEDLPALSGKVNDQELGNHTTDHRLQQQISEIIESIPAKIQLSAVPPPINLNPPGISLPPPGKKLHSSRRSSLGTSSRAVTPSFTLSPAKASRLRHRDQQEIKVYHLSRSTGEPPIKLFIRCVGERGERVMVRVGGGWADLGEYLKAYASHHGRRSAGRENAEVEVRDVPHRSLHCASSRPESPASGFGLEGLPSSPPDMRKTRRSLGGDASGPQVKTALYASKLADSVVLSSEATPPRPSSRLSWTEDDSSFLGLAGPTGKKIEMSDLSRAWVESVKEKVRKANGERRASAAAESREDGFGDLGTVGRTRRLFHKGRG